MAQDHTGRASALKGSHMWGQQPAPAPRTPPARRLRYAHFVFPGQVVAEAIGCIHLALTELGGWSATAGGAAAGELSGHHAWTRRDAAVELQAVIVGLQPVIVSVGQRSNDLRVRLDAASISESIAGGRALANQLATMRRALRAIERAVRSSGGWPVRDVDLLGHVRQAQERFDWWVRAEHRIEGLTGYLTHRRCPDCQGWSRHEARWCRCCGREFGPRDNLDRDDARASAEREIAALRAQPLDLQDRSVPPRHA